MAQDITDIIAERRLSAKHPGSDVATEVIVRLGRPREAADVDWICPVQILGLGAGEVSGVYGADAVQALMLALRKAGIDLEAARRSGIELRWLEQLEHGFP